MSNGKEQWDVRGEKGMEEKTKPKTECGESNLKMLRITNQMKKVQDEPQLSFSNTKFMSTKKTKC